MADMVNDSLPNINPRRSYSETHHFGQLKKKYSSLRNLLQNKISEDLESKDDLVISYSVEDVLIIPRQINSGQ